MKSVIRSIIVLLLIAAVAAIGWLSYGFREWDPEAWKDEIDKISQLEKTEEQPVVDGDGNELDPDAVNPLPSSMTFSSALNLAGEATSVTVTAEVRPVSAINKKVDWSVEWKNAGSAWATGKTVSDYVSVTPTSDGASIATVECKQAFSEQIILTCASQLAPEIKDTATIDYIKNITGFIIESEYEPIDGALEQSITQTLDSTQSVFEYEFPDYHMDSSGVRYTDNYFNTFPVSNVEIAYSDGTITPTDIVIEFYFTYDPELKDLLESLNSPVIEVEDHYRFMRHSVDSLYSTGDLSPYTILQYNVNDVRHGYSMWNTLAGDEGQIGFYWVNQTLTKVDTYGELEVVISYNENRTYSKTFDFKPSSPLYPSTINITEENIVF